MNTTNNRPQLSSYGSNCDLCGGSGYILKTHKAPTDIYGTEKNLEYASPCPRCSGQAKMDLIGLPLDYHSANLNMFNFNFYGKDLSQLRKITYSFVQNFDQWEQSGKGIYVWSRKSGTGKTFLSSCIANGVAAKGRTVRFITLVEYLEAIKKTFNSGDGELNRERDYTKYMQCDLLVIDDLASEKNSAWVDEKVFQLVNGRMSAGLTTIYTSNCPPEKLPYHQRIVSRIIKSSVVFALPEIDIRGKIGRQQQEKFLNRILS